MIFMAIQLPDVGTGVPADQTGDSPWLAMKKVRENFSDQSNAASRLVGKASNNLVQTQDAHEAVFSSYRGVWQQSTNAAPYGLVSLSDGSTNVPFSYAQVLTIYGHAYRDIQLGLPYSGYGKNKLFLRGKQSDGTWSNWVEFYSTGNTTKDANGFLKGASPIIDMYDSKIDLNNDATEQGGITFEKLGVGDYLIKGTLGFAQEGWYIETPKDANGNVLVAVVYKQLENNDLSIKTYAKKFDDETGDIVPNLLKPRDIPTGRFISLRLHELPKEPPVMPMDEPTAEV